MASDLTESQGNSLPAGTTPFSSVQDPSNTYSPLQLLTSQQGLIDPMVSMSSGQLIPFTAVPQVATSQIGTPPSIVSSGIAGQALSAHPELTFNEEALFYVSQTLQGLPSPLQPSATSLVMAGQEPPLSSNSEVLVQSLQSPINSSSLLTPLASSQLMLVSSAQYLPLSLAQVPPKSSTLTMSSANLTSDSQSLIQSSQLSSVMSHQCSNIGGHQLSVSSTSDPKVATPSLDGTSQQETMLQSDLEAPLEDLMQSTAGDRNILEEATGEMRGDVLCLELKQDSEKNFQTDLDRTAGSLVPENDLGTSSVCDAEYPEALAEEWSQLFKEKITPYFGYVDTLEEAKQLLKVYELCTDSKFLGVKKCDKTNFEVNVARGRPFRYTALVICGHKLPFDGVPYYHGGKGLYYCHLGSKRKEPPKDRPLKHPKKRMQSKKVGCMARVAFRVVARFPEYKLKDNTEYNRLVASQTLSKRLKEGQDVVMEWRVYVMLPRIAHHTNHEIIPTLRLRGAPLDRRVIGRICQLVKMGLRDTATIQRQVVHFAENVLKKDGMEWKQTKDICGSRQVWWYRKQVLDLLQDNKLEGSKFMEMIREVEEIAEKHDYIGYVDRSEEEEEEEEDGGEDSVKRTGSKWRKRTYLKNKKNYEKQLNKLKMESFTELETITKHLQSCTQVEVLARLRLSLQSARETFEKGLKIAEEPQSNGCFDTSSGQLQFIPNVSHIVEVHQCQETDGGGDNNVLSQSVQQIFVTDKTQFFAQV